MCSRIARSLRANIGPEPSHPSEQPVGPRPDQDAAAGRWERWRARTHERLLSAALELFAAQGFAETTRDQIAERADVARRRPSGWSRSSLCLSP
ncbi:MAG TPA: helix-turn-helix domain-containing protein [Solirubrobacteraceae bacterium]|nr:helix-turn-helix domain-containing protein [Solirubrobacteraceae bacterium]